MNHEVREEKLQNTFMLNGELVKGRDIPCIDLFYPQCEGNADTIEVGLCSVRAADSIRITYDFERDGYSVQQASTFSWSIDDRECDGDWQEVAFIQAWARKIEP